jgi:hypothetical protein
MDPFDAGGLGGRLIRRIRTCPPDLGLPCSIIKAAMEKGAPAVVGTIGRLRMRRTRPRTHGMSPHPNDSAIEAAVVDR